MRTALPLVVLLLLAVGAARAAAAEFVRVWPSWRSAESFERIGEYFGRGEVPAGQIVVRTRPETRAGYYFLVRVKHPAALAGARFVVDVIRPDAPDAKTFSFPAAVPAGETVFQLGLTGADWPGGEKAQPVAWRLVLLAADGRPLAEHKSFLWEKPAK
jgi:hypothetical protein